MTGPVISAFRDAGLFWQPPAAVAKVIVGVQADKSIIGKAFYIEGSGAWEFEGSFYDAQPQWLGMSIVRGVSAIDNVEGNYFSNLELTVSRRRTYKENAGKRRGSTKGKSCRK